MAQTSSTSDPAEEAGDTPKDEPEPAEDAEESAARKRGRFRETLALILLSITAIFTAWCGFESSKWGGEMSIAFSQASGARIEAARQQGLANNARQEDLTIYALYVQARATNDTQLAHYVQARFTDHFTVAFDAWVAAGMPTKAPFAMPQYVPPGAKEAAAADQRADQRFTDALVFNQRGDNYTLLTVFAALVLFFAAVSTRLRDSRLQWFMLGLASILFIVGAVIAATFPVNI